MASDLFSEHGVLKQLNKRHHSRVFTPEQITGWLSIPAKPETKVRCFLTLACTAVLHLINPE